MSDIETQIPEALRKRFENVMNFIPNAIANKYVNSLAKIRAIFKGNQGGGTGTQAFDAVLRVCGMHPVASRNVLNEPVRFVSKVLPKSDGDVENQQYVEFKRLLPNELIKQDVTARSTTMTLKDCWGGSDNRAEFMSSKQDIDAFMSVPRSALYQDEEIERLKWDENQMRLLKEGGDSSVTLTPVKGLDWMYDSIWKRAKTIYRSETICNKYGSPAIENINSGNDIEAFCWATDDNPIMDKNTIERLFESIDDDDELAMRRYGVFRQVSYRVYKIFDTKVHVKPFDKVFNAGLFSKYWNFRVIDYHPQKKWYITYVVVTPTHEWVVWKEMLGNHDLMTTIDIRDDIKKESLVSEDSELNRGTLVDPLAKVKQPNTGWSVFDDLGMGEFGLRRLSGADTKNMNGREHIKVRLKNALACGVPGNNLNKKTLYDENSKYGQYMPTLWFLDSCPGHVDHFRSWRYVDFKQEAVKAVRETKKVSEKYSDFCRNLEFLGALNPTWYSMKQPDYQPSSLFQGNRRAA